LLCCVGAAAAAAASAAAAAALVLVSSRAATPSHACRRSRCRGAAASVTHPQRGAGISGAVNATRHARLLAMISPYIGWPAMVRKGGVTIITAHAAGDTVGGGGGSGLAAPFPAWYLPACLRCQNPQSTPNPTRPTEQQQRCTALLGRVWCCGACGGSRAGRAGGGLRVAGAVLARSSWIAGAGQSAAQASSSR